MSYPSTFVDIQNAVLAKGRLDATADLDKVKDWINAAQARANMETEALVTLATMSTTASVSSYTFPSAAVRIKALYVTAGGVQYRPLAPVSLNRILELRQGIGGSGATNAYPQVYALVGLTEFEVFPTPDGTETITVYYLQQPTALSADADVPQLPEPFASKVLEYGALVEAAEFKRDDSLQGFAQQYEAWIQRLRTHLNRLGGGIPLQMEVYGSPVMAPHDPATDWRG